MRSTTWLQMQIHQMDFKNKIRKTGNREQHHDDVRFVSRASPQYQCFLDFQELHAVIFTVTSFVDSRSHTPEDHIFQNFQY